MIDSVRHFVALLMVVTFPPALAYWLLIHPFIGFWRRLGPWLTYAIVTAVAVMIGAAIYQVRGPLLSVEFGTNYALFPPAVLVYGVAAVVEFRCRRHLTFRTLVGLPELAPDKVQGKLLTEGIYAEIRHPRYVGVLLGTLTWALFTNYLAVYLLVLLFAIAGYFITLLEERELRSRFGEEYERYSERVPRFIPRFRSARPQAD